VYQQLALVEWTEAGGQGVAQAETHGIRADRDHRDGAMIGRELRRRARRHDLSRKDADRRCERPGHVMSGSVAAAGACPAQACLSAIATAFTLRSSSQTQFQSPIPWTTSCSAHIARQRAQSRRVGPSKSNYVSYHGSTTGSVGWLDFESVCSAGGTWTGEGRDGGRGSPTASRIAAISCCWVTMISCAIRLICGLRP
jgi:hypothetical protein